MLHHSKNETIVGILQLSRKLINRHHAYYICLALRLQADKLQGKRTPQSEQIRLISQLTRVIEERLGGNLSLEGWMREKHPLLMTNIPLRHLLPKEARVQWLDSLIAEAKAGGFNAL